MSSTAVPPDVSRHEHVTRETVLVGVVLGFLVLAGLYGFFSAARVIGWGSEAVAAVHAVSGLLLLALAAAFGWLEFR